MMSDKGFDQTADNGPDAEADGTAFSQAYDLSTILTFRLSRLQASLNAQAADLLRRHGGVPLALRTRHEMRVQGYLPGVPHVSHEKWILLSIHSKRQSLM